MLKSSQDVDNNYMSTAIPKALLSVGVKAPEEDARLQSPSESDDVRSSSRNEYLIIQVIGCTSVLRYTVPDVFRKINYQNLRK